MDCAPVSFLFGMIGAVGLMVFIGLSLFATMGLLFPLSFGFKRRWEWQSPKTDPWS